MKLQMEFSMRSSFSLVVLAVVSVLMLSGCATSLTDSLLTRDYDAAKEWIVKGADVNEIELHSYTDDHPWVSGPLHGTTPLCYSSALYKHCETRGYGWKAGTGMKNWLCVGTLEDQLEVARQLIEKGAKVNAPCGALGTPLSAAAYHGNIDVAKLLIANKANVNSGFNGSTPLHYALFNSDGAVRFYSSKSIRSLDMVKLLIENGADVNAKANTRLPRYFVILDSSRRDLGIQEVEDSSSVPGITPLMLAYARGEVEIGNYLVKKGARSGDKSSENKTARDYYNDYVRTIHDLNSQLAAYDEAQGIKAQRDKAESRETWTAVGTAAAGVAAGAYVGNRTKDLSVDQRQRMMNSAMNSVVAGDSTEFNSTSNQVTAERSREQQRQNSNNQGLPIAQSANSTGKASGSSKTLVSTVETRPVSPPLNTSANREVVQLLPALASGAWSDCKDQALNMDQKHRKANCTPGTLCEYGDGIRVSCVDSTGGAEPPTMSNQTRSCADLKRRAVSGGGQLVREFGCGCFNPNGTGYMDSYNNVTCQYLAIIQKNPDTQGGRGGAMSR